MRVHPDDREATLDKTRRSIEGEDSAYDTEFRIVLPDGRLRYIEAHGRLHRDAQGHPLRLIGLNRDVTAERQTQENLRLAEERWQLALEGNNDGVWDWNIQTGEFYYDSRYAQMLGYEPGELPSVYADGPFSPAGEAKREKRENAAPKDGPFSPTAEAKRAREAAKRDKALFPY